MKTETISEEIIKPSKPTSPHLTHLKPSLFDDLKNQVLAPLIFFFSPKNTHTCSFILNRLKTSLPATLSVFYPLAGRIQNADHISCNDEGVPFVCKELNSTCLSEIILKADVSVLDSLLPSYITGNLLLAIQLTSFSCGGIAIGIKMNHAISDAFSIALFIKTWAGIANGESHTSLPRPYFEAWKQFPAYTLKTSSNINDNINLLEKKPVTKWFLFRKQSCDALRSKFGMKSQSSLTLILSAYICSRINLASKGDVNTNKNTNIRHENFQSVNIRPKMKILKKPYHYFGNMVMLAISDPKTHTNELLCYSYLVGMEESIEKIRRNNELIEDLEHGTRDLEYAKEHFEKKSKGEIRSTGFSSFRSLPIYEADFGWGKPVWVTSATQVFKDFVILIPAGESSQDTCAFVCLSPDEMTRLENDSEFLSFVSDEAAIVNSKL